MNHQQQSSSQQAGGTGTAGVSADPYQHVMGNMNQDNLSYISDMIKKNKQKESKKTANIAKNSGHSRAKSSLSNYEMAQQKHLLPEQQAYQKQQQQQQLAQQEQQQQQQQPQSSSQIPKKSLSHRSLNETLPIFSRAAREEQKNELSFKLEDPLNDGADDQEENAEDKIAFQNQSQNIDAPHKNSDNTQQYQNKQIKSNKSEQDQLLLAAAKQQLQQQHQQYESDMNESTGPSTKKSEHAQQFLTFLGNYVTYLSSNDDPVSPAGGKTAAISLVSGKSMNDLVEENQVLQRELECLQAEFKEEQYTKKMQSIEIARLIQAHNEQKQHLETARYELWECSRRANEAITLLNRTKQLLSQEKAAHKKTHQFSTVLLEQLHNLQSQQQQQQQSPLLQQKQFQQYSSKAQRALLIPRDIPNSSINLREIDNKQQGQQLLNSYDDEGDIEIDENTINNDNMNNELIENGNDFSRSNEPAGAILKHQSHHQFTPTHSNRRQSQQQQRQQQLQLGGASDNNEIGQQSQVFSSKSHQQLRNLTNLAYQNNNINTLNGNNILSYNGSPLTSVLSSQGQYHPSSVINSNSHNPPSFIGYSNNNSVNKSQLHNNSNNYSQYQLQLDHVDQSYLQDQPSYIQQLDQRSSTTNHQEARKKYRSMHVAYNSNGDMTHSDAPSANESFIQNSNDVSRNHSKNSRNNQQLLQFQQQQLVNAYANSNILNDESYYRSSRTPSKNVSLKSSGIIQSSSSAQQPHPSQSHQSQPVPFDFFSRAQQKHH